MITKKEKKRLFNSMERIEEMYRNIFDILSEASSESQSVRDNVGKKKFCDCIMPEQAGRYTHLADICSTCKLPIAK